MFSLRWGFIDFKFIFFTLFYLICYDYLRSEAQTVNVGVYARTLMEYGENILLLFIFYALVRVFYHQHRFMVLFLILVVIASVELSQFSWEQGGAMHLWMQSAFSGIEPWHESLSYIIALLSVHIVHKKSYSVVSRY